MNKWIFYVLFLLLLICVYKFGRGFYMPVVHKLTGKETTSSIQSKLRDTAKQRLIKKLRNAGQITTPDQLVILAFKEEQVLELYAKDEGKHKYLMSYPFTATSGRLGPKLKEGDRQIPEGIYDIEYLNPNSAFHLSMKLTYPNAFDRAKGQQDGRTNLGSDIFIHGKEQTIGCIPIGDPAIEELFLLVSELGKEKVRVIVSPWDFRAKTQYPQISSVTWTEELYKKIEQELLVIKN